MQNENIHTSNIIITWQVIGGNILYIITISEEKGGYEFEGLSREWGERKGEKCDHTLKIK